MTDATQGPGMAGGDTAPLLARARAALEGTTRGPWLALDYTQSDQPAWHVVPGDFHGTIASLDPEQSANANFTAAARTLIPDMADALAAALGRVEVLERALTEIAAFDDVGACQYHDRTGGYAAFDEPGAVETARAALKGGAA